MKSRNFSTYTQSRTHIYFAQTRMNDFYIVSIHKISLEKSFMLNEGGSPGPPETLFFLHLCVINI